MTFKSKVLLSASAFLMVSGGAMSSDLPVTKGEAVEYVKVCSAFGPGFFYIPGTDTCLKIGGEIRADYRGRSDSYSRNDYGTVVAPGAAPFSYSFHSKGSLGRDGDRARFGTQGRIWFDARTETEYGLLRSYFQINASGRTAKGESNKFEIDKAFIQFGGLTAGYAHSFFGYYDNFYGDTIWAPYYAESNTVNLIAYTAQFGGGLSATLGLEDGRDHRTVTFGIEDRGVTAGVLYGGQELPDLVGNVLWEGDWGAVQASGALHQVRVSEGSHALGYDDKLGYAVGGTALIKIPAIEGGHFIVEGAYASGALDYLGIGAADSGLFPAGWDAYPGRGVNTKLGKGWSIVAELGGNITPVLAANLVGSYISARTDENYLPGITIWNKYAVKEYTVAGNLTYTIIKGLTIGGEISYTRTNLTRPTTNVVSGNTLFGNVRINRDAWEGGIRIKRTF